MRPQPLGGPPGPPHALDHTRAGLGLDHCRRQWCGLAGQRELQHLVDPLHRADLQVALDVVGDLDQVFFIVDRNQHVLDATAAGSQQLFLESADGQHFTAQRDFAGHGHV